MKKIIYVLVVIAALYGFLIDRQAFEPGRPAPQGAVSAVQQAFENRQSNLQVNGAGLVSRILPDDNDGSRHQRFILDVGHGQTLLIAHNIDLAPRLTGLKKGDRVEFHGEYEWNPQGGVVHWTHHDPAGRHVAGWLNHDGRTYQ